MSEHDVTEAAVIERVRKFLTLLGNHKSIKTSGDAEPDIIACVRGRTWAIECKQPGKRPTEAQRMRLREWARTGALAMWTEDGRRFWLIDRHGHQQLITPEHGNPLAILNDFDGGISFAPPPGKEQSWQT
jgi:hypothetical protein